MKLPRFLVGKKNTTRSRVPLNVPDENVLSLRKKDDFKIEINITRIRDFLKKNRKLAAPVSILIVVLIIFSVAIKGKASIVNFYPETCLGGWENPSNTEGQPSVASDAQGSDFTRDNSAFLKNRAAQMFCGDFGGEVPDDSVPRKFTVRFSWFVDDGSYDKGEKIINEKLDEGRNVQTKTEENEDTDSVNQGSDESTDSASDSQTDSSADENTDDSSIPSNEDGSSDLPSSEMPQDDGSTNEESSAPSSPDDSGGESGSSDDSSGSDGGSSESTSGSSDGGGESSDSGGSDSSSGDESSSGGEGAFFERFFTRVFAQEAESPAPQSEQQSEPTQEEVSEPAKEENTPEESPLEEITEPVEAEVPSEESGVLQTESSSESENEAESSEENTQSENQDLESNGIVSLDETARDDLFKVMYTLDGTNWEELGVVKRNNWKNVEFDIPFSSVDSWEKLSKVQIAIESLPTIDSFPETYLDSVWVSVEYEGVNPDPLPQPDFLTDNVLNDIRYENVRVIKILKPDGEYQIWYAFVPPSLLATVDSAVGSDEIIKSGDTSLQIIDASTVPEYDPLIGPLPQNTEQLEENTIIENTDSASEETTETKEEVLGDSIAVAEEVENIEESVSKEDIPSSVMTENTTETNTIEVTNTTEINKTEETNTTETSEQNEIKPLESVIDFLTGKDSDEKATDTETNVSEKSQEPEKRDEDSGNIVLNEEIIKEEGDSVDLRELNQPEWHWDLVARGVEVHPEFDIAVDSFKLFWITQTGDSFNMFGLDSSGTYSGIYIGLEENIGVMSFSTPSGTTRFARFNRDTKKFMFSDE
ncbi:MAG: hypothetical protein QG563_527 [Patescibacteria group bacterium]|nr:hypothetical protein [Patescibacteria group bacterium]